MVFTLIVHLYAKDDASSIQKLHDKLIEASGVYIKDQETLSWFVMHDPKDPRAFTIIERYEKDTSIQYHRANPYYKTFGSYVAPLLARPMEGRGFIELEKSNDGSLDSDPSKL